MLSSIIVRGLFNLYDYDIALTNTSGEKMKFITAPNGYGKTTILDFVYGVMNSKYSRLYDIPFSQFSLFFSDQENEYKEVRVQKTVHLSVQEEKSDETGEESRELLFSLIDIKDEEKFIEQFTLTRGADGKIIQDGTNNNLDMFFVSQTCHYIDDKRLLNVKTEYHDETLYINSLSIKDYADDLKRILLNPETKKAYANNVEVFKTVIDRCDFANKRMEIDERFGFRFVANDDLETKLSPGDLSSGEKHMIIQTYELLFKAQEGTLVMIDEPELSLHIMWQMNYLKNLSEIIALRGFQCIIATHSPQIFNSLWSLSVDLFTISNKQ